MNEHALDRFFRGRRVAILSIPRDGRSPLSAPVWYDYDGKSFRVQVEATSAKARAFAKAGTLPVSLAVQSEIPPYRYAVVHGPATLRENEAGLRRRLARRYFGRLAGDLYVAEEVKKGVDDAALRLLEIVPERTVAHDFHPEAGVFGRLWFGIHRRLWPTPA